MSIAGPFERVQISGDPDVWIDPQWTGGDIYDVNILIRPDCASRPTRLLFPAATLVKDFSTSFPVSRDTRTARGNIALSYDGAAFPVIYKPSLVRTISDDFSTTSSFTGRQSGWSDYVDIAPGRTTWFVLRFALPPMELDRRLLPKPESVPERFSLHLDALDVGCSAPLTLKRSFPLNGRELLLKLGPRAT